MLKEYCIAILVITCTVLILHTFATVSSNQLSPFSEVEKEAQQVSQEFKYSYPDFVCTQFSNELTERLLEKGWIAWEQSVDVPQERCIEGPCIHSLVIVAVPIDAITGEILTPERMKENGYEIFAYVDNCDKCLKDFNAFSS